MKAEPYREPVTGEIYDPSELAKKLAHDNRSDEVVESDSVSEQTDREEKRKYSKGVIGAVLVIGIILGIWIDRNAVRAPEYVYGPAPTVTITEHEKEVIHDTTPSIPASCRETLDLIARMTPHLESVLGSSGKISDILSQARVAIASQDHKALIDAGNKNNQLSNAIAGDRGELEDLIAQYQDSVKQCAADLK